MDAVKFAFLVVRIEVDAVTTIRRGPSNHDLLGKHVGLTIELTLLRECVNDRYLGFDIEGFSELGNT